MNKILGVEINEKYIYALFTLIISYLIYRIILGVVNRGFELRIKKFKLDARKQKTIRIITKNTIRYAFLVVVLFTILGVLGVNAGAIITSIGIIGLAIGLAVQDILRDVLAGIFILVENQYAIGDLVMINGFKGEVIFLGLKSTKIRGETGEIKILSNRNIVDITNYSLNNEILYIDINLSYDNDTSKVERILIDLAKNLSKKIDYLKSDVEYVGIEHINIGDTVTHRLKIEIDARHESECENEVWKEIKMALEKNEIR